jgi:acetate kinase
MKPANPRILTVNGGSSSIKFALKAVGHRVVHGGPKYSDPQLITKEMVEELRQLTPFDPEHLPEEILLTEAFHRRFPDLPQVACFDTAFHHDLPLVARFLPIPRRYEALGVRRYGFHGLSYSFLMGELARLAGAKAAHGRIILAHLGNGASLAAVRDGKPVDTSMGFTPTAGVPMSTRSGDLDPGLVWYLACSEKMSAKQFNEMVSFQSGLLGISETSSDMRDLMQCEAQDVRVWGSKECSQWSMVTALSCYLPSPPEYQNRLRPAKRFGGTRWSMWSAGQRLLGWCAKCTMPRQHSCKLQRLCIPERSSKATPKRPN